MSMCCGSVFARIAVDLADLDHDDERRYARCPPRTDYLEISLRIKTQPFIMSAKSILRVCYCRLSLQSFQVNQSAGVGMHYDGLGRKINSRAKL